MFKAVLRFFTRRATAKGQPLGRKSAVAGPTILDELDASIGVREHIEYLKRLFERTGLTKERREAFEGQLRLTEERANDPTLRLAVIGEFSSGKSTFINALIRKKVLKSAHLPTTASATFLTFGKRPVLRVRFRDGSICPANEAEFQALRKRVARFKPEISPATVYELLDLLTAEQAVAEHVAQIDLEIPAEGLHELVIIDTPGIGVGGEYARAHAEVTERVVREAADAAIVLIPADRPMTRTLIEFLETTARHFLHRCIFVITKADHVDEQERPEIVDFVTKKLSEIAGKPVSAVERRGDDRASCRAARQGPRRDMGLLAEAVRQDGGRAARACGEAADLDPRRAAGPAPPGNPPRA